MNYMEKKNQLMTIKLAELESRPNREQAIVANGFQTVLSKQDFLTLVGWKEEYYNSRSDKDKMTAAEKNGVIFHESKGRGKNTKITVTITNLMWRMLMVGDVAYSKVAVAYLEDVFNKKGELELGGVSLVAVLDEYAEKYAQMFDEKVSATKRKVSRVRAPMNIKGYLDKGKKSRFKQKRVICIGESNYLQGPEAVRIAKEIDISYFNFSKELEKRFPIHPDDNPTLIKKLVLLHRKRRNEHTEYLEERYSLKEIYNNYGSTLSERAEHDYKDIITLFMAGATIEEIKSFLEETLALWKEEQTQIREFSELFVKANNGDEEAVQKLKERNNRKMEELYAALKYIV